MGLCLEVYKYDASFGRKVCEVFAKISQEYRRRLLSIWEITAFGNTSSYVIQLYCSTKSALSLKTQICLYVVKMYSVIFRERYFFVNRRVLVWRTVIQFEWTKASLSPEISFYGRPICYPLLKPSWAWVSASSFTLNF